MHMVFTDEKKFFTIVQTTPDLLEAEYMCRGAKIAVLEAKQALNDKGDTSMDAALNKLLTRINLEIHYVSQRLTKTDMLNVIRDLWGEEGVAMVNIRLAALAKERLQQGRSSNKRSK